MATHQVLEGAIILTLSGIIAKSADFLFRAYYSQILGSEGMGLLSLVFGIHGIMLTIATAGLGVAVSKVVSEYFEKGNLLAVKKCMKIAIFGVVCLSLSVISISMIFAPFISEKILGDVRVTKSICCLVPSILFMGISYCIKGYFYATRKVIIPASSELLEQGIKFIFISIFLKRLAPLGIEFACSAVFLGITIGEMSSFLYLLFFYFKDSKKLVSGTEPVGVRKSLLMISVPTMLSSLIGSILRMQEDICIVSSLEKYGMSHTMAISNLGMIDGMIIPMLIFPLTLMGSMINLLIPEISRAFVAKDKKRLKRLVKKSYIYGIIGGVIAML
ncbi:MAG: oligosaccharide flippase family protein, partial [Oscillospiraceae bacterium]